MDAAQQSKLDRESRLLWQSRLLLFLVLALSVLGLLPRVFAGLTPATAEGLAICAAFGILVWLLRAATPFAAVTGFLLTSSLYLSTVEQPNGGCFHTALLCGLALFILAFAATRFRRSQKEKTGLAESRRGRGASQVAANMGMAALVALLMPPSTLEKSGAVPIQFRVSVGSIILGSSAVVIALVAALAEAAADTVSSEIGQALGGKPMLITNGRGVAPGTDGGVTFGGTVAGAIAAFVVVVTAIPTLQLSPLQAAQAWIAAIAGLFVDSLLGATFERHGWLNNDMVNFLSTTVAALIALSL